MLDRPLGKIRQNFVRLDLVLDEFKRTLTTGVRFAPKRIPNSTLEPFG